MNQKELILNQAEKIHQELKEKLQSLKSVALSEAWKSLQLLVASTVQITEAIGKDLDGKEKKDIVTNYINSFYDTVFLVVDIPLVPHFLETIIHSYVKKILMILVSSTIDATVSIFKQTGIFLKKGTT